MVMERLKTQRAARNINPPFRLPETDYFEFVTLYDSSWILVYLSNGTKKAMIVKNEGRA